MPVRIQLKVGSGSEGVVSWDAEVVECLMWMPPHPSTLVVGTTMHHAIIMEASYAGDLYGHRPACAFCWKLSASLFICGRQCSQTCNNEKKISSFRVETRCTLSASKEWKMTCDETISTQESHRQSQWRSCWCQPHAPTHPAGGIRSSVFVCHTCGRGLLYLNNHVPDSNYDCW